MTAALPSSHIGVLCFLFFATSGQSGEVLQPRNVSALWVSDFIPRLSWDPPQPSRANCSYRVTAKSKSGYVSATVDELFYKVHMTMEGGFMQWHLTAVCNGSHSKPLVINITYQDLVKNLTCFLYSPSKARCQWSPVGHTSDFRFYYQLTSECGDPAHQLRECSSYEWTSDGVKSGCELEAARCQVVLGLFNATLNGKLVRNTFKRRLNEDVRPPPLTWTVNKSGNKFNVSWEPPEIKLKDGWTIQINYTECGETHTPLEIKKETWHLLELDSSCRIAIAVRAKSDNGGTAWSDWRHFGEDPNVLVLGLTVVPLLLVALVVLFCVWFQKNKEIVFPEIPQPVNYLSEFSNNNKSIFHNHYIPAKEEDHCNILLVVDPQLSNANC